MVKNELMYMNWREMIKSDKVRVTSTEAYGKFVCETVGKRVWYNPRKFFEKNHSFFSPTVLPSYPFGSNL